MPVNNKRILLISIAITLFVLLISVLLFFVIGMGHGYDSAMIENKIEENCNCKVEAISIELNPEDFVNEIKSSKTVSNFTIQLTDCKYDSIDKLKDDIVSISQENNLCQDRNINFIVPNFKSNTEMFTIQNCNL